MTDTPSAGRFDGKDHLLPVRVYYEDTDFTGLVYHASYVRFFERGRSDFLRSIGIGHASLRDAEAPGAFALAKLDLAYLRPARIDDALTVRTRYRAIRGPRLIISQRVERDGQVLATAEVTAVFIHMDGRPRRPSPAMVEAVSLWLSDVTFDG